MLQKRCEFCGARFEAKRKDAKFCSTPHRMAAAAARRRGENVVPLAPKTKPHLKSVPKDVLEDIIEEMAGELAKDAAADDGSDVIVDVRDAVKAKYRGQLKSPLGQVALKLARSIDNGDGHVENVSRELRMVMAAMDGTPGADAEEDPLTRARNRHRSS